MNVKILRIILILSFFVTAVGGFSFWRLQSQKIGGVLGNLSFSQPQIDSTNPTQCTQSHEIEYLFYTKPHEVKNNKIGLYIYAEEKKLFDLADELVNSNGGDWGYVLIPYNVTDRNRDKWKRAFEISLEKHLIPIIQLNAVDPEKYEEQTKDAAEFLNSFVWPIRQRYVSVYNEPNDAKFWHGKVDPEQYAQILRYTIAVFKKENLDFFMLNGALNTSAAHNSETMDAEIFMREMDKAVPGVFNELDGWASHPYPQPNFSGSPKDKGRWSIRAYEEELNFLKNELKVDKELPVFITETGWAHSEGENFNHSFLPVSKIAEYMKEAYEKVWLPDDRVVAVTPFTVWYEPPFDHFAWVNRDRVPYEHFQAIKTIKKVKGSPEKLEKGISVSSEECR